MEKNDIYTNVVNGAMNGDSDAMEKLVELITPKVLYIATTVSRNYHDGEDVAQEAMIRIIQHIGQLKEAGAFPSWMYRTVVNTALIPKRKNKNIISLEAAEGAWTEGNSEFLPQEYAEEKEKREALMKIIQKLPQRQKACILLYYYCDISYRDIAESLQIKVKDVENALMMARKKIRKAVEMHSSSKLAGIHISTLSIPVLTKVFTEHMTETITSDMTQRIIQNTAIGMSTGTMTTLAAKVSATIIPKVAAGVAAASVVIGVGIWLPNSNYFQDKNIQEQSSNIPSEQAELSEHSLVESPILQEQEPIVSETTPEPVINTIVDLIGNTNFERLLQFVENGTDESTWTAFLKEIGAEITSIAEAEDSRYSVYSYVKQTRELMLIAKADERGNISVAYRFCESSEEIPKYMDIYFAYNEWRQ